MICYVSALNNYIKSTFCFLDIFKALSTTDKNRLKFGLFHRSFSIGGS